MSEKIFLPQEMEKDRAIFEKSQRTILRIMTHKPEVPPGVYASKMGGNPYFPLDMEYPCNGDGKPLFMIAQINFADIDKLPEISQKIQADEYLQYLPTKGILSFFIDYDSELNGLNLEDPKDASGYRVMYFPEVEMDKNKLISNFSFLGEGRCRILAPDEEYIFSFQLEQQLVSLSSYEWQQQFEMHYLDYIDDLAYSDDRADEIYEEYIENSSKVGHQIGGYPFFTQEDPRYEGDEYLLKYNFVMLQLNSDDYIMWGDTGIANFLMPFEKLKQLDFSDVLFNWDCY